MPDQLFEHFRLETTPPPVEEVRRRGDRRRRRTAAALSIGGAVAVVAVVVPFALTAHGTDRGEPQPSHTGSVAPTPSSGWVTAIPASFDLTAGMAQAPAPTQELVDPLKTVLDTVLPVDIGQCDAPIWEIADTKRTLLAEWTDRSEGSEIRTLSPYPDADAAGAAFGRIQQGLTGCSSQTLDPVPVALDRSASPPGGAMAWVQPNGTGGDALGSHMGRPDGTGTAYVVMQVHNVLIIDRASMNGASDAAARRHTVHHLAHRLSAVAQAAVTAFPSPTGAS